jgi:hypothetical protein
MGARAKVPVPVEICFGREADSEDYPTDFMDSPNAEVHTHDRCRWQQALNQLAAERAKRDEAERLAAHHRIHWETCEQELTRREDKWRLLNRAEQDVRKTAECALTAERALSAAMQKQLDDALVRAAEDQDEHSAQRAALAAELRLLRRLRDARADRESDRKKWEAVALEQHDQLAQLKTAVETTVEALERLNVECLLCVLQSERAKREETERQFQAKVAEIGALDDKLAAERARSAELQAEVERLQSWVGRLRQRIVK